MIIRRKYVTYGQLCSDEPSKKVLVSVFEKYSVPKEVCDYILDPYNDIIVMNTDMGSGIPGDAYQELRNEFDKLDDAVPFDNGLTYADIDRIESSYIRNGSAIKLIMICNKADLPERIVQVIAFEDEAGSISFIEPWD